MASEREKWVEAVTKMLKLTQEGKLKWIEEDANAHFKNRADQRVELVFTTVHRDRYLRLYELTYQVETVDVDPYTGLPTTSVEWKTKPVLEIINKNRNALWKFPNVNALRDLLASVQYQVAGVKDFLEGFMNEE